MRGGAFHHQPATHSAVIETSEFITAVTRTPLSFRKCLFALLVPSPTQEEDTVFIFAYTFNVINVPSKQWLHSDLTFLTTPFGEIQSIAFNFPL